LADSPFGNTADVSRSPTMDPLTSSEVTVTEVPRKSVKAQNADRSASDSRLRRGDGDRYEILSELATGGMATVYLGRLRGPHGFARLVAVKAMHPQLAKDRIFHDMFLDEARLSARIRHPNVVPTIDVVSERGHLLLVMEYVEGESLGALARLHREKGGFPQAIACAIAHDMLAGLHGAHETTGEDGKGLGLIHRDVSPQNILVGVDGLARVLDFGVAKAAGRVHVTQSGEVKGKIPYMPPEQLAGEDLDRTVDVYAAGVVLWEMLTGRRLFDGPNEVAISL
jgi:serine/threonine-protein kinase